MLRLVCLSLPCFSFFLGIAFTLRGVHALTLFLLGGRTCSLLRVIDRVVKRCQRGGEEESQQLLVDKPANSVFSCVLFFFSFLLIVVRYGKLLLG